MMSDDLTSPAPVPINPGERLVRIETKLDVLIKQHTTTSDDHEKRLRGLERWRYALPTSLVLALGSTAVAVIALLVQIGHKP